ncbi:protein kinase [Candidatus Uabimicrobium sp. HlEnr_7]|uniref:protein kinase domain-containing protein n=1 Tax=Candidatus Uabimicrobium helgolandensis TaxID=3095367 RepID=UPI003557ACF0
MKANTMTLDDRPQQRKKRILVVDDELTIANFCAMILNEAGMTCFIVQEFDQVESNYKSFQPDLILLDFHIPEFDTIKFIQTMRQERNDIVVPIVVISTNDNPDNILYAYDAGADDFIEKPIHPDYLISVINSRINRMQGIHKVLTSKSLVVRSTQKLSLEKAKIGTQSSAVRKISIADDILRKFLLDFDIMSPDDMKNLLRKQRELEQDDYFVRLYDLINHLKMVDTCTLDYISLLKDVSGKSLIEGYEANKIIAEGGMGLVYKGHDKITKDHVAIKVFYDKENVQSIDLQRFIRECNLAQSLDHSGITKAYNFGEINEIYYIVMEYIDGVTLTSKIKSANIIEEKEALAIFGKALETMIFAWEKNIIHRDLKPDNIMLTTDKVKICDLGLAKAINSDSQLTQDNVILGTPFYMSPEQCMGKELDYRTDVYSLGVTLYVMLTGHTPFQGNFLEVAQGHMTEHPPEPSIYDIEVSSPVREFLYQLLEKMPEFRCSSTKELWKDFCDVKAGRRPYSRRMINTKNTIRRQFRRVVLISTIALLGFFSFWGYHKFENIQNHTNIEKSFINNEYQTAIQQADIYLVKNPLANDIQKIRALSYFKLKKYNQAVRYFTNVAIQYPKDLEVLWAYSYSIFKTKSTTEASLHIKKALKIKKQARLYYLQARIHFQQNNKNLTIKNLKNAISVDKKYWRAYYLMGITTFEVKWFQKLFSSLEKQPQQLQQWLHYSYGVVLFRNKKYEEAKAQFSLAQNIEEKQEISYYLGVVSYYLNNYKQAIILLQKNSAKFSSLQNQYNLNVSSKDLELGEDKVFAYLAKSFYKTGNNNTSLKYINQALRQNPQNIDYLKMQVIILESQKKYQEVVEHLDFIINNFPQEQNHALLNKAINLFKLPKWQEALPILNILIQKNFQLQEALPLQIKALIRLKKYDLALQKTEKYLASYPDNTRVLLLRGKIYEEQGNLDMAIKDYQTIVQAHENLEAYQRLIQIFYRTEKYLRVADAVNKVFATDLVLKDTRPYLLFYRGVAYYFLNRLQESTKDLSLALQEKKKLSKRVLSHLHYYQGLTFFKQSKYDKAQKVFDIAIKTIRDKRKKASIRFHLQEIKAKGQ